MMNGVFSQTLKIVSLYYRVWEKEKWEQVILQLTIAKPNRILVCCVNQAMLNHNKIDFGLALAHSRTHLNFFYNILTVILLKITPTMPKNWKNQKKNRSSRKKRKI